jgi:SAM-dependent methyltransferase
MDFLKLPQTKEIKDIDSPEVIELHKNIIRQKYFLKRLYSDWYSLVKEKVGSGLLVELGSGGGFLKEVIPDVITSDIIFSVGVDVNFSVLNIPFKDNTIDTFLMLNVLHHINDPLTFFKELYRCLIIGGKIVMIEPANTLWGRFIWKNFHHENFDISSGWALEGDGPLSCANSALPWIIFFRDKEVFKSKFPKLNINKIKFHTPLRYLVSGGLSMQQLLPSCTYNLIKYMEFILSPFNKHLGMFCTVELEKIP